MKKEKTETWFSGIEAAREYVHVRIRKLKPGLVPTK